MISFSLVSSLFQEHLIAQYFCPCSFTLNKMPSLMPIRLTNTVNFPRSFRPFLYAVRIQSNILAISTILT